MYIPYEDIFNIISKILPENSKKYFFEFGQELKIRQNVKYIEKNYKSVIKRLRKKISNKEKLIVAFYVYDESKWKSQSIYDLLNKSEEFIPYIFVSKNCSPKNNFNYQTKDELPKIYNFFRNKNMNVLYAYDFEKDDYISFEKMTPKPDIIFYSHPWYVYKTQGPVMTSKFALTYYIPYFLATSVSPIEYYTRFHRYIENHCVINSLIKNDYSSKMINHGKNVKALGHPQLDYFYLNKNKYYENKGYVIYAPHWSVTNSDKLRWGTFLWSGEFMKNYAKQHPEIKWIFKPHPCLANYLINQNIMSENEVKDYWDFWNNIGKVVDNGDYLDLFMQSKLMITDCGSFETEYFMTKKPSIYLKSSNPTPFNTLVKSITDTYYKVENSKELGNTLNELLLNNNDYKKIERENLYKKLNLSNHYAAKNIIEDIEKSII